jgi:hypothetical protein
MKSQWLLADLDAQDSFFGSQEQKDLPQEFFLYSLTSRRLFSLRP